MDKGGMCMLDVIIIGSGPAGLAAAIYAMRAGLQTLVLEKQPMSGTQSSQVKNNNKLIEMLIILN